MKTNTRKLLENNTGYSIKNYFIWLTLWLGAVILLITAFLMIWAVIVNKPELNPENIIGAVAAMFTGAGLPKIAGEFYERNLTKKQPQEDEPTN